MSPVQCARARLLLGWSRQRLGDAAGIPVEIVEMFEENTLRGMPDCESLMRDALEGAGVNFPFLLVDGEFVAAPPTLSPPAEG